MPVEGKSKKSLLSRVLLQIFRSSKYRTQAELAKKLGLSTGALSNYLREGGRVPDEKFLLQFLKVCGASTSERVRYRKMLEPALLWRLYPKLMSSSFIPESFPSVECPLVFRNQVRQDLSKIPKRRVHRHLLDGGVSWTLVQGMLDGRWIMNDRQVRLLAKALGADEAHYLSLMAASDYAHELAPDEQQLQAGLTAMSKASQHDLVVVQGQMRRRASPRSRPKAGPSTSQ